VAGLLDYIFGGYHHYKALYGRIFWRGENQERGSFAFLGEVRKRQGPLPTGLDEKKREARETRDYGADRKLGARIFGGGGVHFEKIGGGGGTR